MSIRKAVRVIPNYLMRMRKKSRAMNSQIKINHYQKKRFKVFVNHICKLIINFQIQIYLIIIKYNNLLSIKNKTINNQYLIKLIQAISLASN